MAGTSSSSPTDLPGWRALAEDPERGRRYTLEAGGLYLDYSKNRITDQTLRLLVQLAEESGLRSRIDNVFDSGKLAGTVPHVALRAPREASILVDGVDVGQDPGTAHPSRSGGRWGAAAGV
jgi:glucose-6-phosphate isomerase